MKKKYSQKEMENFMATYHNKLRAIDNVNYYEFDKWLDETFYSGYSDFLLDNDIKKYNLHLKEYLKQQRENLMKEYREKLNIIRGF